MRTTRYGLFIDDLNMGKMVLQQNARPGLRPYIHQLRSPNGLGCLTEDMPYHHPWQHGIETGFHGVNGCEFWEDPGQKADATIGSIEPSTPRILDVDPPRWCVEAIWQHEDGSYLMAERQTWTLQPAGDLLYLDLDWRLMAITDVSIEQCGYGGFFIRMPWRKDRGADVINSDGLKDDDCEQHAAAWVDLYMPIDRNEAGSGITTFDHPANPGHPAYWRVDGNRGINPSPCIRGAIDIPSGRAIRHQYRLVLHDGPLSVEDIQAHWKTYTAS